MSLALKISLSLDVILPESVSSRKKSKIKHLQLGLFFTHFLFQLGVVQPRDRGDWISGIRRAVDLSSGGQLDQGETSWE